MSNKIIGIDLGTTNSVVAILEGGIPAVVVNAEGQRTTPSIVAYGEKGELFVGAIAKRQTVVNAQNTFYSIKRFIGCKYDEIKNEIDRITYTVKKDSSGNIKLYVPNLKKDLSPEQISAEVLRKLASDASRYLNEDIDKAIITVPAYFNDSQRLATKDAGVIAGLDVLRILNEPTAAALAYGLNKKQNETILIFDLGGGTFDVSILEVGDEIFEVLATSGDTHLGGDDFDRVIMNYILSEFEKKEGIDLRSDKQALQRIIDVSEKTKIELSAVQSTRISLPFICLYNQVPKSIDFELDRSKFEQLSKDLLLRCKQPLEKAIQDSSLKASDISQVILVGGSTRIPAVRNLIKSFISKPLNESVNPDEVVALGAAVQAGILAGEITDLILLDVTPLSLGVETMGGIMTPVIVRNTAIPVKQSEMFSTGADNQTSVDVHVLQGERPLAKDNKSLGIFQLNGIPAAPRAVPQINVTFQLDVDGLLSVSAKEEESGVQQSIKIEGASVLPREEVSRMIQIAEENANLDKAKKSVIRITYDLDVFFVAVDEIEKFWVKQNYANNPELKGENEFTLFQKSLILLKKAYKNYQFDVCLDLLNNEVQFTLACVLLKIRSSRKKNIVDNDLPDFFKK